MATAGNVKLSVKEKAAYTLPGITQEQANKASEVLQENHEHHHIFFNKDGFHNHIVHHILTIWAMNASSGEIQKGYDHNRSYQRSPMPTEKSIVEELHDPAKFMTYLGPEKHFPDFLVFFKGEIDKMGWEEVLQKYVFASDERAEDMYLRMFGGLLHPIIHLGFGVEFRQPAIIAEALAQAACHNNKVGQLLLPVEKAAKERGSKLSKTALQILDEMQADEQIRTAAKFSDGDKLNDGVLGRAGDRTINLLSQYHVKPEELESKTAELLSATAYSTAAAQHPPNAVKYDFFLIHCLNSSIFIPALLSIPSLSTPNRVRLLESFARFYLAFYASRGVPTSHLSDIQTYTPAHPSGWDAIVTRVNALPDDGHASKVIRALMHGQQYCAPWESKNPEWRVKGEDWVRMGHMAIDSVERAGGSSTMSNWVRSAGFDEAWVDVPLRAQL